MEVIEEYYNQTKEEIIPHVHPSKNIAFKVEQFIHTAFDNLIYRFISIDLINNQGSDGTKNCVVNSLKFHSCKIIYVYVFGYIMITVSLL